MKQSVILLSLFIALTTAGCAELEALLRHAEQGGIETRKVLTNEEMVRGLRDALAHGTDTAVTTLHKPNGYYGNEALKIMLPKEAKPIYDRLEKVPLLDQFMEDAVLSINRAAEDAAKEAAPIFQSAIRQMTIQDAKGILTGSDSAATHYLRENTYQQLYQSFKPKILQALSKEQVKGMSAERAYEKVINTYNTASVNGMLWDRIENNSLAEHTTRRALDGLFVKIAEEEKAIRTDPVHRVTDILKEVFGYDFNP